MDLFNKANGHDKKELYKAIFRESMKILIIKGKNPREFMQRVRTGTESFRTQASLAVILEAIIMCIGKFEQYHKKHWDINKAYKQLRKTFKNMDQDSGFRTQEDLDRNKIKTGGFERYQNDALN